MRGLRSKVLVLAVCGITMLDAVPAAQAAPVGQLAQFSTSNRSSTSNYRANRGLIKLGVLAVVVVGTVISRVLRSEE